MTRLKASFERSLVQITNHSLECLELLKSTDNGTGFMHESFYKNDPSKFTRTWFAWANAQFGHLILKLAKERPYLIFGNQPASV
jgi:meiotically up-regulated gene 157 (Mug157) protein